MSLLEEVLEHYGLDSVRNISGWQPVVCPFHDDETASASVNLELDGFRCHACGTKGDAIGLIMSQEELPDRASAERFATEELGVSHKELRKFRGPGKTVPGGKKHLQGGRPPVPPGSR